MYLEKNDTYTCTSCAMRDNYINTKHIQKKKQNLSPLCMTYPYIYF